MAVNEQVFGNKVRREFRSALDEVGKEVTEEMRSLCPVKTGYLRSTIGYNILEEGDFLELEFYATADYASYVEYGTERMAAQSFFRPPLMTLNDRILSKIGSFD